MTRSARTRSIALALATLSLAAACDQGERTLAPTTLSERLDIQNVDAYMASSRSIKVGQTISATQLSGAAAYASKYSKPYTVTSTKTTIASVTTGSWMVTGRAAGGTMLIVKTGTETDTIPLSVVSSTTISLSITSPSLQLAAGSSLQLSVVTRNSSGSVVSNPVLTWASSSNGIATVTSAGKVTGVAAGGVTIRVSGGGVTTSIPLTVTSTTAPPPVKSGPLPALGSGGVALPKPPTLLNFSKPPVTGRQWVVNAGGSLQNALNSAQRGDEIVLQAGASFVGNFILPKKTGTSANGWITIRSSQLGSLPAGTRVGPSKASLMPKILSPNATGALRTAAGTSGWWIAGVEFGLTPASWVSYGIVLMGEGNATQNSLSVVPFDLVLDRVYIHASPTQQTSRCLALNSARTEIRDSYLYDCHAKGFDTQAIAGWNGPGPYRIYNNMLAGAGENVMFGGANPTIPGLVPSDIEIRRNYLYTPSSWKGVWTKKNIFELKNAVRVHVEGNVLDGSWIDGQVGFGVMIYSTNQGNGSCRWCRVTDVMMRRNLMRNVTNGYNISGKQTTVDTVTSRVALMSSVIENLTRPGDGRLVQLISNGRDLTIDSLVAMGGTGIVNQFLVLDPKLAWTNFRFSNSVVQAGAYGMFSSYYPMGETALQAVGGNRIYGNMWLMGASRSGYPTSTFVSSESQAPMAAQIRSSVASATSGVAVP